MIARVRKLAFRSVGYAMPDLAARWFEAVLLTPRRAPETGSARPCTPEESSRLPYGNGWLAVRSWGEGPAVLLIHGWGATAASLHAFVDPLVARGFRVVAYDHPAHGNSDGMRTNLIECAGAALQVGRTAGPLHAIVAHSFGGPTAAMALRYGLAASRVALLAPPASIMELSMDLGLALGFPRHVIERMAERLAQRFRVDWSEIRTDRLVRELSLPLLVVHDADDRTVPHRDGVAVARAARRATLLTTRGLGHQGILGDATLIERVVGFVAEDDSPLLARAV